MLYSSGLPTVSKCYPTIALWTVDVLRLKVPTYNMAVKRGSISTFINVCFKLEVHGHYIRVLDNIDSY